MTPCKYEHICDMKQKMPYCNIKPEVCPIHMNAEQQPITFKIINQPPDFKSIHIHTDGTILLNKATWHTTITKTKIKIYKRNKIITYQT